MRASIALLFVLGVTGCVAPSPRAAPPPPPPRIAAPPPRPAPMPAPLAVDWRDWPVTRGTWTYARDPRGSVAMFGRAGEDALAVLRCDRSGGRVFLSVAGTTASAVTVRTSSVARSLPVGPAGGTPAYLAATLTPADPLLDALAFSRGRFALSLSGSPAGAPPLVLPAWAEVGRVIEDCRS